MILITKGNLFDLHDMDAVFVPVNIMGVMGAGMAKEAATRFPHIFRPYYKACKDRSFNMRTYLIARGSGRVKQLILVPTKDDWKNKSDITTVETCFKLAILAIKNHDLKTVGIPPLGCGLGGVDLVKFLRLFYEYFEEIPQEVYLSMYKCYQPIKLSPQIRDMAVSASHSGLITCELTVSIRNAAESFIFYTLYHSGLQIQMSTEGFHGGASYDLEGKISHIDQVGMTSVSMTLTLETPPTKR